jgi:hypothetical protein
MKFLPAQVIIGFAYIIIKIAKLTKSQFFSVKSTPNIEKNDHPQKYGYKKHSLVDYFEM